LLGSVVFNYGAGYLIGRGISRHTSRLSKHAKLLLAGAIAANLILLGYFKYANFLAANINQLTGAMLPIGEVFLPLGISFFTFTQIAFLVDTYQGKVKEYNFVHYTLFVTYFPHLIAGPVLHHKEMMPQFANRSTFRINWNNVSVGLAIFVLGLAKKVLIADSLADFATPIFDAIRAGGQPMLFEAWVGALSYTLQLYFDFSGYSDMAIGLSLMFNVRLPMNFNSPYKATSIIEFWRCWHMTLSRFLRDYLYFPLGGNRNGKAHRYLNLMITMLLGGLWHGAGWTFIIWGGLHGVYLMMNHSWRGLKQRLSWGDGGGLANLAAGACTFLAVIVAWVFFRADSFSSAMMMLHGMVGMNGISLPERLGASSVFAVLKDYGVQAIGATPLTQLVIGKAARLLFLGLVICFYLPNTRQIAWRFHPTIDGNYKNELTPIDRGPRPLGKLLKWMEWQPTKLQGAIYGGLFFLLLMYLASASKSEFLYFQF
jgi:alginate O-acetyltransferase complex protein AlgI